MLTGLGNEKRISKSAFQTIDKGFGTRVPGPLPYYKRF